MYISALTDVVYPLDRLNVSSCDTQKLVLGWNINQKIYDISLRYLCVNPSGVRVSARTNMFVQHTLSCVHALSTTVAKQRAKQ